MPSPGAPRPAAPWGLFPVRRPLSEVPASGAPPLWRKTVLYHPPPREGKPERRVVEGCTQLGEGGGCAGREGGRRDGADEGRRGRGWGSRRASSVRGSAVDSAGMGGADGKG
jgi:hypothetical protein